MMQQIQAHSRQVTSLASSSNSCNVIASSSSDRLLKVWDVSTFLETSQTQARRVNAIVFDHASPFVIYYSSGKQMMRLDTRSNDTQALFTAQDEINAIDLNSSSSTLALADDAGSITLIDIHSTKPLPLFGDKHANIASTVKFKPGRPYELWSGGYDCALMRWDFTNGLTKTIAMGEIDSDAGNQSINPPFVLDMICLEGGLICGLGSGEVCLVRDVRRKGKSMVHKSSKHFGHDWSVSKVIVAGDQIATGGIDGKVVFWQKVESSMSANRSVEVNIKVNAMCSHAASDGCVRVFIGGNLREGASGVEGNIYIL